jgi:phage replication O-like protein O
MKNDFIPNSFQVPNIIIDGYMQRMSANAFRIYMVLVRKTKGWHKDSDSLSQSQIMALTGIQSEKTVRKALDGLIAFEIISEQKKTGCQSTFFVSLFVEKTTPVKITEVQENTQNFRKNYGGSGVKITGATPVKITDTKEQVKKTIKTTTFGGSSFSFDPNSLEIELGIMSKTESKAVTEYLAKAL